MDPTIPPTFDPIRVNIYTNTRLHCIEPGISRMVLRTFLAGTLDSQETVARILVDFHAARQVGGFRSLVLAEVVDGLLLAAAKDNVLGV
jgi:hypothetical protein